MIQYKIDIDNTNSPIKLGYLWMKVVDQSRTHLDLRSAVKKNTFKEKTMMLIRQSAKLSILGVMFALTTFQVQALEGVSTIPTLASTPVTELHIYSTVRESQIHEPLDGLELEVIELQLAKSGAIKSRSEVVNEVKRSYGRNVEVLKISLNSSKSSYQVRILMPDGKVKSVSVNARK